jgi:hypothetical protein
MGHSTAVRLLQLNLNEEGDADQKLSNLAEMGVNQKAAIQAHSGGGEDSERSAARKSRGGKKGGRKR